MEKETKSYKALVAISNFLKKLISPFTKLFSFASDYAGSGAEFVKILPVLMIALAVSYPLWSFPIYLWLSVVYGEPLNYILYTLWISQILIIIAVVAYFDYTRKNRSQ